MLLLSQKLQVSVPKAIPPMKRANRRQDQSRRKIIPDCKTSLQICFTQRLFVFLEMPGHIAEKTLDADFAL